MKQAIELIRGELKAIAERKPQMIANLEMAHRNVAEMTAGLAAMETRAAELNDALRMLEGQSPMALPAIAKQNPQRKK